MGWSDPKSSACYSLLTFTTLCLHVISGVPDPPVIQDTNVVSARTVLLNWNATTGEIISNFSVELSVDFVSWKKATCNSSLVQGECVVTQKQAVIIQLKPYTNYTFRVVARDQFGTSNYSAESKMVLTDEAGVCNTVDKLPSFITCKNAEYYWTQCIHVDSYVTVTFVCIMALGPIGKGHSLCFLHTLGHSLPVMLWHGNIAFWRHNTYIVCYVPVHLHVAVATGIACKGDTCKYITQVIADYPLTIGIIILLVSQGFGFIRDWIMHTQKQETILAWVLSVWKTNFNMRYLYVL